MCGAVPLFFLEGANLIVCTYQSTVNPCQQGGISEKDKCVVRNVGRFDADREHRGGATGPVQRGRGDDGSLAHRVKGCGSEQKTLSCHGRQIDARGKPTDHVPRGLDQSGTGDRSTSGANDLENRSNGLEQGALSEVRLRQVIDTIPTLAWCNLADVPNEFLNKRWHEYTGLSPEEPNRWGWQASF